MSSCKEDDTTAVVKQESWAETVPIIQKIHYQDIENLQEYEKIEESLLKYKNYQLTSQKSSFTDFTIDSSNIVVTTMGNKVSYTFVVDEEGGSKHFFKNIILQKDEFGQMQTYLATYSIPEDVVFTPTDSAYIFKGRLTVSAVENDGESKNSRGLDCTSITLTYCNNPYNSDGVYVGYHTHVAGANCINNQYKWTSTKTVCGGSGSDFELDDELINENPGHTGGGPGGNTSNPGDNFDGDDSLEIDNSCPRCLLITPVLPENCESYNDLSSMATVMGLSTSERDFILNASCEASGSLFSYYIANQNDPEAIAFLNEAIDAGTDGTLITPFPLFRYSDSTYINQYPNFTNLIKNYIPELQNDILLIETISDLTGVSEDSIKQDLQWGQGPNIVIEELGYQLNDDGEYEDIFGQFQPENPSQIKIDISLVNLLENISNIENPQQQDVESLNKLKLLIVFSVCIHEYVHYADYDYDNLMEGEQLALLYESLYLGGYYVIGQTGVDFIIAD